MERDLDESKLLWRELTALKLELRSMKAANQPEKEDSFRVQLCSYSQETTCHGVRYFINLDHSWVRKFVWLALWLTCVSVYGHFAVKALIRYTDSPVVSNYEVIYAENLEFPAFSICHYSTLKRSLIDPMIEEGKYPSDKGLPYARQRLKLGKDVNLAITGGKGYSLTDLALGFYLNSTALWNILEKNIHDQNLQLSVLNYTRDQVNKGIMAIDVRDNLDFNSSASMITESEYRSLNRLRLSDLIHIDLDYLYWNAAHPVSSLFSGSPSFSNDTNTYQTRYDVEPFMWRSGGKCYTLTFYQPGQNSTLQSSTHSEKNILELPLQVDLDDVIADPAGRVTINQPSVYVMFHEHNHLVRDNNFEQLMPGNKYATEIKLKEREVLSKPYNEEDCLDTNSADFHNPLRHYSKEYTHAACLDECKNGELIDQCGCYKFGFPSQSNLSSCKLSVWKGCGLKVIGNQFLCKHCLRRCFSKHFDAKTKVLYNVHNSRHELTLEVTMDLAHEKITQTPAFPVTSLLGEVGGLLGMYIGASLLSVAELADFFIVMICKKTDKRNAVSQFQ